jgi:hypothetical protein
MPAKLFKLVISVDTTIDNNQINPDIQRYYYEVDTDDIDGVTGVLTIDAEQFVDDNGDPLQAGEIPEIDPVNGYYLLFVNGVLQQDSLYTVTATEVTVDDASTLQAGTPVVLVVNEFAPSADANNTVLT